MDHTDKAYILGMVADQDWGLGPAAEVLHLPQQTYLSQFLKYACAPPFLGRQAEHAKLQEKNYCI